MMKINRLPEKKRKAALMRRMQDIVLNNKDLPFYKKERRAFISYTSNDCFP